MYSKKDVDKDVLVIMTNKDTQETTEQAILKKNGPEKKTTCPTIRAKNKPHLKIETTGTIVSIRR